MLSKEMMKMAEARCLELVNDGEVYKQYNSLFQKAAKELGLTVLVILADEAKQGRWKWNADTKFNDIPPSFIINWEHLRERCKFSHYESKARGTVFSRTVFGLVLEDWLISHKEAPSDPAVTTTRAIEVGDKVRLLVGVSLGGSKSCAKGSVQVVKQTGVRYASIPCIEVKGGHCYRPEDVELVVEEKQPQYKGIQQEIDEHLKKASAHLASHVDNLVFNQLTKEKVMSLKIETKTFVNGDEIAKLSVEALVSLIRRTEDEIRSLEALESKPKKVVAKIEELKAGLAKLVEFADAE